MRDHEWLESELALILKKYFSDVKITNPIEVRFGREAKYRFGSIRLVKRRFGGLRGLRRLGGSKNFKFQISNFKLGNREPEKSVITITSMFKSEEIPVAVVRHTIAHELCHYAHGFSSYNRRLFKHPHHGGVVNAELERRGASDLISTYKKWLKAYRKKILISRRIF